MGAVQVVLLLGALEGFLSLEIEVFQAPEVHAAPGSVVFLPCTYKVPGEEQVTIGSYKWYRHLVKTGPEVSDSNDQFSGRITRATAEEFINNRTAHLIIHNVDPTDTGMYYCEVSIHGGTTGNGNGTALHVTEEEEGDTYPSGVYISLGTVFGIVAVVVLVVGYYRTCNQALESAVEV
ncbi:natural cytotoxicity triggering receptor 3-like [Phyllobates terribilis]|uniref:natural cytotoxicity triggering receptor 3-like n=1 Tax=Phyllobates terribilis TaxID=111132 RepID=UPI003CCAB6AA